MHVSDEQSKRVHLYGTTAKVTFAHQEREAKAGYSNGGSTPFGYLRREVFVTGESRHGKTKGGL